MEGILESVYFNGDAGICGPFLYEYLCIGYCLLFDLEGQFSTRVFSR